MMIGVGIKSLVVYLPMLEWLPRLRLNGSALPLSGPSPVSVSLEAFFFLTFYIISGKNMCAYEQFFRGLCDENEMDLAIHGRKINKRKINYYLYSSLRVTYEKNVCFI